MKRLLQNSRLVLTASVVYTVLLLVLSLIKTSSLPHPDIKDADKIFHLCAYFALTVLWQGYYFSKDMSTRYRPSLWICAVLVGFGVLIEILQFVLTSYRSFEFFDILADAIGVALAFGALWFLYPQAKLNHDSR